MIYTHLPLLVNTASHHDYHATLFEATIDDPQQAAAVAAAIDARIKEKFEVPAETKRRRPTTRTHWRTCSI